jgi:LuxR family maltose regulon positive regulatory protein
MPEIAKYRINLLLKQGDITQAISLAKTHHLPISQAKVKIEQENYREALMIIHSHRKNKETMGEMREVLEALVMESLCHYYLGEPQKASTILKRALTKGKAGGFVRLFLDEGNNMYKLLSDTTVEPHLLTYRAKLLSEFEKEALRQGITTGSISRGELIEPLSERELEILRLIAQGYSNQEISKKLFLALNTVKGHNRNLFGKLGVKNRTEAVLRVRQLGFI